MNVIAIKFHVNLCTVQRNKGKLSHLKDLNNNNKLVKFTSSKLATEREREGRVAHLSMPVPQPTSITTAPLMRDGLSKIACLYASILTCMRNHKET